MELPLLEGGMQMLGPRMGVHDGDCLACTDAVLYTNAQACTRVIEMTMVTISGID